MTETKDPELSVHPPPKYKRATPYRHMSGEPKPLRYFAMICGLVVDTLIVRTWIQTGWKITTGDWLLVLIFFGASYMVFPDELDHFIGKVTKIVVARFSKGGGNAD